MPAQFPARSKNPNCLEQEKLKSPALHLDFEQRQAEQNCIRTLQATLTQTQAFRANLPRLDIPSESDIFLPQFLNVWIYKETSNA